MWMHPDPLSHFRCSREEKCQFDAASCAVFVILVYPQRFYICIYVSCLQSPVSVKFKCLLEVSHSSPFAALLKYVDRNIAFLQKV